MKMSLLRITLSTVLLLLVFVSLGQAQVRRAPYGLPVGALVVEERALALKDGKQRSLVLWMLRPKKYPRTEDVEFYTCPEETRGSFYRGPVRVSLVDTAARRVVNTLKVLLDGEDEFDLPYRIHAGGYYHVEGVTGAREGRPTIVWLRDINGDGRAEEFALYDAEACMGLGTALFGYSEKQDRVIQYPLSLAVTDSKGQKSTELLDWADYLFAKAPMSPGRWKYEIDYRGRGGSLDSYDVRYNPAAERFEGTLTSTTEEQQ